MLKMTLWGVLAAAIFSFFAMLFWSDQICTSAIQRDILLYAKEERVIERSNLDIAVEVRKAVTGEMDATSLVSILKGFGMGSSRVAAVLEVMPAAEKIVRDPGLYNDFLAKEYTWRGYLIFEIWATPIIFIIFFIIGAIMDAFDRRYIRFIREYGGYADYM